MDSLLACHFVLSNRAQINYITSRIIIVYLCVFAGTNFSNGLRLVFLEVVTVSFLTIMYSRHSRMAEIILRDIVLIDAAGAGRLRAVLPWSVVLQIRRCLK